MDSFDHAIADRMRFIRNRAAELVREGQEPYRATQQATHEYEVKCQEKLMKKEE